MFIQNIKNNKIFNKIFENAILVGSSGDLVGKNKGEFINSFPLIIRMNEAPTIGFEKDVGNRTDIRIINFRNIERLYNLNPREFLHTKHLILHTNNENDKFKLLKLSIHFPKMNIYIFTKDAINYNDNLFLKLTKLNRNTSGSWLSIGWYTMFFLINFVKNKSIIGLGGEFKDSKYSYYKFQKKIQSNYYFQSQNASQGHRFFTEKQIFNKWIIEKQINYNKL